MPGRLELVICNVGKNLADVNYQIIVSDLYSFVLSIIIDFDLETRVTKRSQNCDETLVLMRRRRELIILRVYILVELLNAGIILNSSHLRQ